VKNKKGCGSITALKIKGLRVIARSPEITYFRRNLFPNQDYRPPGCRGRGGAASVTKSKIFCGGEHHIETCKLFVVDFIIFSSVCQQLSARPV
jgi:hypothetical protein